MGRFACAMTAAQLKEKIDIAIAAQNEDSYDCLLDLSQVKQDLAKIK